jgi:hypothetical protein
MARRRRKTRGLADVGPRTRHNQAIRDGITGLRRANDRGACRDAAALLKLTEQAMRGVSLAKAEREHFEDERLRFNKGCRR